MCGPTPEERGFVEHFEGHEGRWCGEHRTTGSRAWCFDCSEWCYESAACARCALPLVKSELEAIRDGAEDAYSREHALIALELIG